MRVRVGLFDISYLLANRCMRGWPRGRKQWKVFRNEEIRAHKVLLIDENGEKVWLVPRMKAMRRAQEAGLDLVQLAYDPRKKIATAKIVDYGKYMYEKNKAESEKRKSQKKKGQKEIKFGYNIDDHDLNIKIRKAKEFLEDGYNVKMMSVLRGREKVYKSIAREKFENIEEKLKSHGKSQWVREEQFGFTLILMATK